MQNATEDMVEDGFACKYHTKYQNKGNVSKRCNFIKSAIFELRHNLPPLMKHMASYSLMHACCMYVVHMYYHWNLFVNLIVWLSENFSRYKSM